MSRFLPAEFSLAELQSEVDRCLVAQDGPLSDSKMIGASIDIENNGITVDVEPGTELALIRLPASGSGIPVEFVSAGRPEPAHRTGKHKYSPQKLKAGLQFSAPATKSERVRCGVIKKWSDNITSGGVLLTKMIRTNICAVKGDSGSPLFDTDPYDGTALATGMAQSRLDTGDATCQANDRSWYTYVKLINNQTQYTICKWGETCN